MIMGIPDPPSLFDHTKVKEFGDTFDHDALLLPGFRDERAKRE